MLIEYLGSERNRFFRRDNTVCKNLDRELVIIGYVAYTGVFNGIVNIIDRSVDLVRGSSPEQRCNTAVLK